MSISRSSAYPQSETKGQVASKKASVKKVSRDDTIEYDVVVCMPPKKRYSLDVDVTKISKAKPKAVVPLSLVA